MLEQVQILITNYEEKIKQLEKELNQAIRILGCTSPYAIGIQEQILAFEKVIMDLKQIVANEEEKQMNSFIETLVASMFEEE